MGKNGIRGAAGNCSTPKGGAKYFVHAIDSGDLVPTKSGKIFAARMAFDGVHCGVRAHDPAGNGLGGDIARNSGKDV